MKLAVYDATGKEVETIDADDAVFGLEPHRAVLRQALLAQLANRRAGSANTKTRGEVQGSTRKIRRQKGTGAARQGGIRAPHHRHGGISFGPKPRSFKQALPKRVRRLAIRSALSAKAGDGELRVLRDFGVDLPKTRTIAEVVGKFDMTRSVLLVTDKSDRNLLLSARNLPGATMLVADYLNVADLMSHRGLIMTVEAVRRAEAIWGGERATKRLAAAPAAMSTGVDVKPRSERPAEPARTPARPAAATTSRRRAAAAPAAEEEAAAEEKPTTTRRRAPRASVEKKPAPRKPAAKKPAPRRPRRA